MIPLHLGALHPVEQALTIVLAFGPFVVLGAAMWFRRRQDAREEALAAGDATGGSGRSGLSGPGRPDRSCSPPSAT